MAKGEIVAWKEDRGFGFIQPESTNTQEAQLFFHINDARAVPREQLRKGTQVEYSVGPGKKSKTAAKNVRIAGMPAPAQPQQPREKKAESRQVQHSSKGYRFLNPYNFARWLESPQSILSHPDTRYLNRQPPPPHDRWVARSGEIECELTALTPLFISDSLAKFANETDKKELHKSFEFFNVPKGDDSEPILPASSLRGMVRNIFEAATNSCFASFDYGQRLSYRLAPSEALKLVPARVLAPRNKGEVWRLQLMLGSATLTIGENPRRGPYAATVRQYPRAPQAGKGEVPSAHHEIVDINDYKHGSECYALAKIPRQGPLVWNVTHLADSYEELEPLQDDRSEILKGYLCITNQNIDLKVKERFFISEYKDSPTLKEIELPDNVCVEYEELIRDYQLRHRETVETWRKQHYDPSKPRKIKKTQGREVWEPAFSRFILESTYKLKGNELVYAYLEKTAKGMKVRFIAPVSIPRVGYQNKTYLRLPSHHWKCESHDKLCPACRTFGWVEGRPGVEKNERESDRNKIVAYQGRVQFTHATLDESQQQKPMDEITLAILSSPKPTTSRFYLMPVKAKPESKQGAPDEQVGYDAPDMIIRGRKFFRHHPTANSNEYERVRGIPDDQNRTINGALPVGTKFRFKVRFENLAAVELGALLWALEMESNMCHRLGFAKPLGFGSVRINVTGIRELNLKRYDSLDGEGWQALTEQKAELIRRFKAAVAHAYYRKDENEFAKLENIADLSKMLNTSQPQLPIHYPRPQEVPDAEGKNYEWFMGNKRPKRGPGYLLPLAVDDTAGFPLMEKFGNLKE
ncbi:TIGR03986 family CRISPR-associated RAMP protein [candidate division KSB1 bacterium]|nr:MAG: TIGR03986 family CRISPR-associated RAMP protein [candidate division KSB1 bacterium]MCE7945112.1 TIGR03986 family CRISPR-associated RAMP protein [Chlorobi bacterium CHB1]